MRDIHCSVCKDIIAMIDNHLADLGSVICIDCDLLMEAMK